MKNIINKLMKKRKKWNGLKQQVLLLISGFVILPLILTGVILTALMFSVELKELTADYYDNVSWTCDQMESVFRDSENIFLSLYLDSEAQKFLKDPVSNIDKKRAIYALMKEQVRNQVWYRSICISQGQGTVAQWADGINLAQDDWKELERTYQEKENGHWVGPHYLKNALNEKYRESDKVISYYGKVYDYNDIHNILGVASVNIDASYIRQVYSRMFEQYGGFQCLINAEGMVISSSDPEMEGKELPDKEIVLKKDDQSNFLHQYIFYKGRPCLAVMEKVDHLPWEFLSVVPVYYLIKNYIYMMYVVILAILLCIVFAVAFWKQQNRKVIQPIMELSDVMAGLPKSDMEYRFQSQRKDEIGLLYMRFEKMEEELKEMIQENYVSELYRKDAQMQMLISQINPHFLYNTLDAIRWFAVKENDMVVAEKILQLSNIFRHILNEGQKYVKLHSELDILEQYINIINFQSIHVIEFMADVPEEYLDYTIPVLLLQPIVENSVLHGLKNRDGNILITAEDSGGHFYITVYDDGIGMDMEVCREMFSENNKESHNAFAIRNVMRRIKLLYGEEYGLEIRSTVGEGTNVIINLPLMEVKTL